MIVINHKVNTIEKLEATPEECGVEVDIRPHGSKLILNHEPFGEGVELEEFLKHYKHKLLILNIKSEGIEKKVIDIVKKRNIHDYFLLDVTFPFMIKYIDEGIKKFAVRFSEFEAIETCLNLAGKVEWVFVDNFSKLPIEGFGELKKHFKLCIVAPDLFKRDDKEETKDIIKQYDVDAVLTDEVSGWD